VASATFRTVSGVNGGNRLQLLDFIRFRRTSASKRPTTDTDNIRQNDDDDDDDDGQDGHIEIGERRRQSDGRSCSE